MEKVKLTETQADAVERKVKEKGKLTLLNEHINGYFRRSFCLSEEGLETEKLIKALYIGYEVEPEWEAGRWILLKTGMLARIIKVNNCEGWAELEVLENSKYPTIKRYELNFDRYATNKEIAEEKERRFFAKHDRAVWELWSNDLLKHKISESIYEVQFASDDGVYLTHDSEVREWNLIKQNYLVACFYSDRKDVDNE